MPTCQSRVAAWGPAAGVLAHHANDDQLALGGQRVNTHTEHVTANRLRHTQAHRQAGGLTRLRRARTDQALPAAGRQPLSARASHALMRSSITIKNCSQSWATSWRDSQALTGWECSNAVI